MYCGFRVYCTVSGFMKNLGLGILGLGLRVLGLGWFGVQGT